VRGEVPLILASLFIAFVIWLIAKQSELDTDWLLVPVQMQNIPDYLTVEPLKPLRINVQYPQDMQNQVIASNFQLVINVAEIFNDKPSAWSPPTVPRRVPFNFKPGSVKSELFPTVQVVDVDPKEVMLTASLRTRTVNVKINTTGRLPASLMFKAPPKPDPQRLIVSGSSDALARLVQHGDTLETEPVDLSKLSASTQVFPRVLLPEDIILLGREDNRIMVNVALTEKPVRQTIGGAPISLVTFSQNLNAQVTPPTADVVVEGPASSLKSISAGDIVFSLARELPERPGKVYEVGLEARLKNTVQGMVAQQVRVVEVSPARISVEYVPVDKQNKVEGATPGPVK
jgi:hypothetical protein